MQVAAVRPCTQGKGNPKTTVSLMGAVGAVLGSCATFGAAQQGAALRQMEVCFLRKILKALGR
ncbi:MAG: hypothetical protein ACRCWR_00460 [Saezia sp.]